MLLCVSAAHSGWRAFVCSAARSRAFGASRPIRQASNPSDQKLRQATLQFPGPRRRAVLWIGRLSRDVAPREVDSETSRWVQAHDPRSNYACGERAARDRPPRRPALRPEWAAYYERTVDLLRQVLQTSGRVFTIPGGGRTAFESAIQVRANSHAAEVLRHCTCAEGSDEGPGSPCFG